MGTVKIMWRMSQTTNCADVPARDYDNHRSRAGLTGFVCFMHRPDAERAVQQFDGFDWNGNTLRVTWSKPVPIPKRAAYGELEDFWRELTVDSVSVFQVTEALRDKPNSLSTSFDMAENLERKRYWLGSLENAQLEFLETVAKRVHDHGKGLLNTLRSNERNNPKFNFLFDTEVRRRDQVSC